MSETDASPLPSPTAIKRFIRDTARNIQNDFTTANESLDDFLSADPQTKPQEAGESIQIAVRKTEGAKKKLTELIAFVEKLKLSELEQTKEARASIALEFERLKQSLEANNFTMGALT